MFTAYDDMFFDKVTLFLKKIIFQLIVTLYIQVSS